MKQAFATILVVLTLMPFVATATTPLPPKTANAYYNSCISRDDSRLTVDGQTALCSCTAAKMIPAMTLEDIAGMNDKPATPGRVAYDKMLTAAYGPCMAIPVQEQLAKECMTDSRINQFGLRDKNAMCQCMGRKSAAFIDQEGPAIVKQILERNPATTDLYAAFMDDQTVRQNAYDNVTACLHSNNQ